MLLSVDMNEASSEAIREQKSTGNEALSDVPSVAAGDILNRVR